MSETFIKKNAQLSTEFDDYLVKHPQLFKDIPNGAYIVITTDDANFNAVSKSLIKDKRRKKIVEAHLTGSTWRVHPLQPVD
jgi:hypothetical protein